MKKVFSIDRQSLHFCDISQSDASNAMRKNQKPVLYWLLALCFVFGQKAASAQEVWPGDVNNNGIVNSVDLLWLGIAYDAEGPERPGATDNWEGQPLGPAWPQTFPNGLNFAYADCDGDGEVDEEDIEDAILPNFRLTHGALQPDGFANALPGGSAPRLTLAPSKTIAAPGETITIDVVLGNAEQPVGQFYGIAFTGAFSNDLIADGGEALVFDTADDGWINPGPNDDLESLFFRDAPGGEYEVGMVRSNQTPVAGGFGTIGTFSIIIIEDIIVGLTDTIILQIDSIRLVDQNNQVYAVVPDTARIVVSLTATASPLPDYASSISVFPNPLRASEESWLDMPPMLQPLDVAHVLGHKTPVSFSRHSGSRWRIRWPEGVRPGWYVIRCAGPDGAIIAKSILLF